MSIGCTAVQRTINGCQWMNNVEKLESHLVECAFVEVECQHCGADVQ